MNDTLTLAVCNFLVPEISEIISKGDYPDVKLISFAASCSVNSVAQDSIESIIKKNRLEQSDLIILSSTCLGQNTKISTNSNYKIITLSQCFEPFMNNDVLFHYISKGYYIATNGWIRKLDQHKRNWGFEKKNDANTFFNESMKKILFMDTKIPGDYLEKLKELSDYMDLPYEILPVGLDTCRLFLDSIILSWRNEKERKALNRRLSAVSRKGSDLMVIYDQLEILVSLTDEDKIIDVAFNLINILFAPQNIKYVQYMKAKTETRYFHDNNPEIVQLNEKNSFSFELFHINELYGLIEVMGIRFPQHLKEYREMAKIIMELLSIAIANARKYSQIREQKDQIEIYSQELKKSNTTKDKFFSIIAHDLKGPFNTLLGFSDLLLESIKGNNHERVEHFAEILNQNINETFDLLLNLLEWARTQLNKIQFTPDNIDAAHVIKDIRDLLISQADRKNVFIKLDLETNLKIYADENMFRTIFRNLISNAIKFSNANGIIRVSSNITDKYVLFTVSDSGIGIEEEKLNLLFGEDFGSSIGTSGEKGTGLGLILCKEFIEAHGGRIWVESKLKKGSTFFTYFPFKD